MAQVILAPEEEAAVEWLDVPDETLGRLVRSMIAMAAVSGAQRQHWRMASVGAALMMIYEMEQTNAGFMEMKIDGHTITVVSDDYEPDEH